MMTCKDVKTINLIVSGLTKEPPVWDVPGNAGYVVGLLPEECRLFVPFGCSEAYKVSEKVGQIQNRRNTVRQMVGKDSLENHFKIRSLNLFSKNK